ncbi:hypothetical protein BDN70DRAFT_807496, partial [Pholiota conissans]
RFVDAYERGLNGQQAAWAARKDRGHRVLPPEIMEETDRVGMVQRVLYVVFPMCTEEQRHR